MPRRDTMASIISSLLLCCILVTFYVADVQSAGEGFVRLRDGMSKDKGRVEIYHDGEWGTICDDFWDVADATVVCRWLGYVRASKAKSTAFYGPGHRSQPIWMSNVNCTGEEDELSACVSSVWGDNQCSHQEDAGVLCTNLSEYEGELRLMDGKDDNYGRVEIFHYNESNNGVWGSICKDGWGYDEARVVCTHLGFPYVASPFRIPYFGPGNGPIHLTNVACTGIEIFLPGCPQLHWGKNNCSHADIVGVECSYSQYGQPTLVAPEAGEGFVRLSDGMSNDEGRVEIYHDGEWGTICDDFWDVADATVVCRWLGYVRASKAKSVAFYGPGHNSQPIWLSNVNCTGEEDELSACDSSDWGDNRCSHQEDASVVCTNLSEDEGELRLMDGKDDNYGRVEIFHYNESNNGVWGSICKDGWGYDESRVVCDQLGFPYVASPFRIPYFGPGNGPIHLSNVACTGTEIFLPFCPQLHWGKNNCSHADVVGVECSYSQSGEETITVIAGWLIAIIVICCLGFCGLIVVVGAVLYFTKQGSSNVTSSQGQGYPTAATFSPGQPPMELPPSYTNAVASSFPAEKDQGCITTLDEIKQKE